MLTVVTELAANPSHRLKLAAFGAGTLLRISEATASPAIELPVEVVEQADAATAAGTKEAHTVTENAAAGPSKIDGFLAAASKL